MRLDKKTKKMLDDSGLEWKIRKGSKHHDLFIEGEYVYGFHKGFTKSKPEVINKVRKSIERHKR